MDTVRKLAVALDADDYETAAALIAPDAQYDTGERVITGRDAIVESFRSSSERGRASFDSLVFKHEISADAPLDIRFLDYITHAGQEFALDHTMHCRLNAKGLVENLSLEYPPGERERLREFLQRAGLKDACP